MKSTDNKRQTFPIEDFEKGLLLAGLVTPYCDQEIHEREAVEKLEKQQSEERKKTYFQRAILAAETVSELHTESTFGRIKFQKLV